MPKDTRISFRVTEAKKERLATVAKLVGLTETALAEACVDALCDYVETHGEIRMPLAIIPKQKTPSAIPTPTFPSTASRTSPGAHSVNEVPPRRDAVPGPDAAGPETPVEKYGRIRKHRKATT